MQFLSKYLTVPTVLVASAVVITLAQQSGKPVVNITVAPPEPVAVGSCSASTSGYLSLNGKTAGYTDEELGKMIMPALRQGYVLTVYPPTKRGIFVNQECHGSNK